MDSFLKLTLIFVAFLSACATAQNDSVTASKEATEKLSPMVTKQNAEFVISAVDSRRVNYNEGRLASERSTSPQLREYGRMMMRDQSELLKELTVLASKENVVIPENLGKNKTNELDELKKTQGTEFDRKFVTLITEEHQEAVKAFEKASLEGSPRVRDFAYNRLHLIESHLEIIQQISKPAK